MKQAELDFIIDHFTKNSPRGAGYVLDFSDKTFAVFCTKVLGRDIRPAGISKGAALRAFLSNVNTPDGERVSLIGELVAREELIFGETYDTRRVRTIIEPTIKATKTSAREIIERLDDLQTTANRIESNTSTPPPTWITKGEYGTKYRISIKTVERLIATGELQARKHGDTRQAHVEVLDTKPKSATEIF